MKEKLSIGEFARLINVTTETLRYYDRIGLLKPNNVDSKTGYRYYSILQYEKLGTIKDLRQLGMSIDDINKYFNNRNFKQSADILKEKHHELKSKIKELQELEKSISEKIVYLEDISQVTNYEEIIIKQIGEREIITFDKYIKNEIELSYTFVELENLLKEIAPLVASNRIGTIIKQKDVELNENKKTFILFLFIKDNKNIEKKYLKKIPASNYACMYYKGDIWGIQSYMKKVIKHIEKEGYKVNGDILQIIQIDISVTDKTDEELFEIQVPIKKC